MQPFFLVRFSSVANNINGSVISCNHSLLYKKKEVRIKQKNLNSCQFGLIFFNIT